MAKIVFCFAQFVNRIHHAAVVVAGYAVHARLRFPCILSRMHAVHESPFYFGHNRWVAPFNIGICGQSFRDC